jgi:DNA-binding beta-propeller fold protein YncE
MPRAFFLSLFFPLFFSYASVGGKDVYIKHCASCHHEKRIGKVAPPLIPEWLKGFSDKELISIIKRGLPASNMPAFPNLRDGELRQLITFLRTPVRNISFGMESIKLSRKEYKGTTKDLGIKNFMDVTLVVEKGRNLIWVMEGDRLLDSFRFPNVHGGIKFSPEGKDFYVPARDGHILRYSLVEGRVKEKVRACVYLRNIALSSDGRYLIAGCLLPRGLVVFDRELIPIKLISLRGRLSAVYELNRRGGFIFSFRDIPYVGFLDRKLNLSLFKLDSSLEDFFIDPLEEFLIGSSRRERKLVVYSIDTLRKVYESRVDGLPHLFSSFFWYRNGEFYFATRHIRENKVSIWRMYDWKLVAEIPTQGRGFFVRTHPASQYLWVDDSSDSLLLIDKGSLESRRLRVVPGKRATHTEFSYDGRLAYVSVSGKEGALVLMDTQRLESVKRIPASYPAGKYNFLMKSRRFFPYLLGYEVFMNKCWGCHHQTRRAFAPSFRWIANHRSNEQIVFHIADPSRSAQTLGYKRSAMPKIPLSQWELKSILAFIEFYREKGEKSYARNRGLPEHQ